jgi:hypothetical protein
MSVGNFRVQDYTIRYYGTSFQISNQQKNISLNLMGAYHENGSEELRVRVLSPLHAIVETDTNIFTALYTEDEYEPNGQLEIDVKIPDQDVPIWTTLLNGVPREVIRGIVLILNGDDESDRFRVTQNNENANDPNVNQDPLQNVQQANTNNLPRAYNGGSKKKRKQRTRRSKH